MTTMQLQSAALDQDSAQANERQIRLIMFSLDGRVWLLPNDDGTQSLPRIRIAKWTRVAQQAIKAANEMNLDVFCLWEMQAEDAHYLIARINNPVTAGSGVVGVQPAQLQAAAESEDTLSVVMSARNAAFQSVETLADGPFKRIDWDITLQQRLQPVLKTQGITLTGKIDQINASERFSLLKLETTSSPIWFKAVGPPNTAEYSVTVHLNELIPGTTPPVLAHFPDWFGWVAKDTGGVRLDSCTNISEWTRATAFLAQIQMRAIPHIDELFRLGCADCRSAILMDQLDLFVKATEQAMVSDPDQVMHRLPNKDIRLLANEIKRALEMLHMFAVPNSIIHRDLSGGNIQMVSTQPYFIDWAQACIGFPFICSEYMTVHFSRAFAGKTDHGEPADELRDAYAAEWRTLLSQEQLSASRIFAPLLAAYLYVLPMDGRTFMDLLETQDHRRLLRSMARRMWAEAQAHPA